MKEESYIRNVKYFLEELIRGCGIIQKENPAVQFTKDAKAGLYDNYTDEVYNSMLKDIEDVAKFWHGKKRNVIICRTDRMRKNRNLEGTKPVISEYPNCRWYNAYNGRLERCV